MEKKKSEYTSVLMYHFFENRKKSEMCGYVLAGTEGDVQVCLVRVGGLSDPQARLCQ